jgi:hypothetical protein
MKKKTIIQIALFLLLVIVIIFVVCEFQRKPLRYHKADIGKIDNDIRRISANDLSIPERMNYYSARFLGAPYKLECQGDGPYAKYDRLPLLNLEKINCMTYCEIIVALTLSDYYVDFFNILQHIRYYNGIIGMATRNHYTMVDWVQANSWCLEDITLQLGGKKAIAVERTISHAEFLKNKDIDDIPVMWPERRTTIHYLPFEILLNEKPDLRSGDIVSLVQDMEGIFSAHMLIYIENEKGAFFRHASMSAEKTVDSPYEQYLQGLSENPRYLGMSFMRLKEKIDWKENHGKFIVPLNIISRSEWGAAPLKGEGTEHVPKRITIHHSGVVYEGVPAALEYLKGIQRYHQEDKQWIDIAYHYLIDLNGHIYEGRPEHLVGDTATDYNPHEHLNICLLGNYEEQTPDRSQIESMSRLIADLCLKYDISPKTIKGHKELTDTKCPGKNLFEWVNNKKLLNEVETKIRLRH